MTVIIDTRANCIAKKMGKKIPEKVEIEPQTQGTKNMEISSPSFVCKGATLNHCVNRRLKDVSLSSLSLHGSEGRSSKVLVAYASSAPVRSSATIRTVSADETDVEVVMSLSGATRALVFFCNAVGVKPSPFVTKDFVGKASVTTA